MEKFCCRLTGLANKKPKTSAVNKCPGLDSNQHILANAAT